MVDSVLIILGSLCMLLGIIGCFVPLLPGPPLSYVGLLLLHITSRYSFSSHFLLFYAILTIAAIVLEHLIPIYAAKKLNGSRYGVWGAAFGLVVGLFVGPSGIIVGPILGAFVGETISGKKPSEAVKPAIGSFLGFIAGIGIKLVLSLLMAYHFIAKLLPDIHTGALF
jgi:uncharacterized protein